MPLPLPLPLPLLLLLLVVMPRRRVVVPGSPTAILLLPRHQRLGLLLQGAERGQG
jgi:hypothetical protein